MVPILSTLSRQSRTTFRRHYHRARFALNKRFLHVTAPLPPLTDYSIALDFANLMIFEILTRKPKLILETGCGLSTVVAAHCLKTLGRGLLLSLEHDKDYLEPCQELLCHHAVQPYVRLVHAPLERVTLGPAEWRWYSPQFKDGIKDIDMLIVDGPPATVQPHSRYPAVPILFDVLSADVLILMDDGARLEERDIAARWSREYPCFRTSYIENERGLIRLERT